MRFLIAFLLCLIPATAFAEPLKAILVAPDRADAGSDIFLDGSQSEGEIQHMIFTVTPKMEGVKQIDTPKEAKDPQKPRMRAIPGRWTVTLTVIDSSSDYSVATKVIEIPGGTPCPEPAPGPPIPPIPPRPTPGPTPDPGPSPTPVPPTPVPPTPTPEPTVPAGTFGIAPKIVEMLKPVTSASKVADSKTLADLCDVLAAQIAAGTLKDPQALVNEIAKAAKTSGTFGPLIPQIGLLLQNTIKAYPALKVNVGATGASMADPTAWQTLLKEIGVGLRAVK